VLPPALEEFLRGLLTTPAPDSIACNFVACPATRAR